MTEKETQTKALKASTERKSSQEKWRTRGRRWSIGRRWAWEIRAVSRCESRRSAWRRRRKPHSEPKSSTKAPLLCVPGGAWIGVDKKTLRSGGPLRHERGGERERRVSVREGAGVSAAQNLNAAARELRATASGNRPLWWRDGLLPPEDWRRPRTWKLLAFEYLDSCCFSLAPLPRFEEKSQAVCLWVSISAFPFFAPRGRGLEGLRTPL